MVNITEEESAICKIDGTVFASSRAMLKYVAKLYNLSFEQYIIKMYYNDIYPTCKCGCGTIMKFKGNKLGPWFKEYTSNHFSRNPHTDDSKQKIKNGCEKRSLELYGTKNAFQASEIKDKIKKIMLEKYGVDNIMKLSEQKERAQKFRHNEQSKQKMKEGNRVLSSFYSYYSNWNEYLEKLESININCLTEQNQFFDSSYTPQFKCKICSFIWSERYLLLPDCEVCAKNFQNARSKVEQQLLQWTQINICENIISNKFFKGNTSSYYLDAYDVVKQIGIEMNGLWWHSENHGQKNRNYHVNKMNFFNAQNIKLIQIFEDEWIYKQDIIKSRLLNIFGIPASTVLYARNCEIKLVNSKDANLFLEQNHLQGKCAAKFTYGLYYNNELFSLASFSLSRYSNKYDYELIRFCVKKYCVVVGGFQKLLTNFIKIHAPKSIITYADARFSDKNHNLYTKAGFNFVSLTSPNYFYIKGYKRMHRLKFTKKKLIKSGYDSSKTEWQIMQELKYDRIWDCGHYKYELIINQCGAI